MRLLQRYLLNPPMKMLLWLGVIPGHALIETRGRRTGRRRTTVVGLQVDGGTAWIVADQGPHAGYVHNLEADPEVRVRIARRWRCARSSRSRRRPARPAGALRQKPRRDGPAFRKALTSVRIDFPGSEGE